MGKNKPLKITAFMLDGRINSSDGILMFDAILYHAWFFKYAPQVFDGMGDNHFHKHIGLPLEKTADNRYCASRGIYKETGKTVEYFHKRPDFFNSDKIDKLNINKGIICESAGEYRAYRVPQVIRTIENGMIDFYAIGNPEKIEDLLNRISAVGKKPICGYGIVKKWVIEEIDQDYTLFHSKYGLMRPVEVGGHEDNGKYSDYPIMQYAIKPPYWKVKNMRLCYVPIR